VLLVPNSRLVLCQIFSYDFPKIRNLPKIFLRSFENVGPDSYLRQMLLRGVHWWLECVDTIESNKFLLRYSGSETNFANYLLIMLFGTCVTCCLFCWLFTLVYSCLFLFILLRIIWECWCSNNHRFYQWYQFLPSYILLVVMFSLYISYCGFTCFNHSFIFAYIVYYLYLFIRVIVYVLNACFSSRTFNSNGTVWPNGADVPLIIYTLTVYCKVFNAFGEIIINMCSFSTLILLVGSFDL